MIVWIPWLFFVTLFFLSPPVPNLCLCCCYCFCFLSPRLSPLFLFLPLVLPLLMPCCLPLSLLFCLPLSLLFCPCCCYCFLPCCFFFCFFLCIFLLLIFCCCYHITFVVECNVYDHWIWGVWFVGIFISNRFRAMICWNFVAYWWSWSCYGDGLFHVWHVHPFGIVDGGWKCNIHYLNEWGTLNDVVMIFLIIC